MYKLFYNTFITLSREERITLLTDLYTGGRSGVGAAATSVRFSRIDPRCRSNLFL